jgi:oligopeptide transport system ATP-binding protein
MAAPLLSVRNLTACFDTDRGSVAAVSDVSFDVAAGETLAIVGESGSGKSVTALSLLSLVPSPPGRIASGEIMFDGRDLLALDEEELRALRGDRIAMIFQEPMTSLNPALRIGLQIAEPLNVHRRMPWHKALDRAADLIAKVGMPDAALRREAFPHQFSGGMRQRAMIAMALACEPQLIIADEPTTALDVTVQAQILDLITDLAQRANAALILITHDLGVVARYADRVAVMYAGRIIESAPARSLYKHPKHPYTRGLMQSAPRLDGDTRKRLVPIDGQPPDLTALPPGCAFAPRCRNVVQRCLSERPVLRQVGDDHQAACLRDV